jgi:hypothetical protein
MSTISDPIALAREAAQQYHGCYGDDLVSLVVYGSAAGEEFNQKFSDINLLIVLKNMTLMTLEKSQQIQDRWQKKRFSRPLFMDPEYIARSLDTFPVEFLNMQQSHVRVLGEDVLGGLQIKPHDLRLQIERELKGKWLHLLQGWLETRKKYLQLSRLVDLSLKDFAATFRAMLYLKAQPIPRRRKELFGAVAAAYGLTGNPFEQVLEAFESDNSRRILTIFPVYSQAVHSLIQSIDQQTIKEHV